MGFIYIQQSYIEISPLQLNQNVKKFELFGGIQIRIEA